MTVEWSLDIAQADWWVRALRPFGHNVGSVVPDTFEAYRRIFHSAEMHGPDGTREEVTWHEIAARFGRVPHPEMQFHAIATPLGTTPEPFAAHRGACAWEGSIDPDMLGRIAVALAPHTTTPDRAWFAVWDGFGQLHGGSALTRSFHVRDTERGTGRWSTRREQVPGLAPDHILGGPKIEGDSRAWYLLTGPLAEITDVHTMLGHQSPTVFWPHDRAWIVAGDTDFAFSYAAGTAAAMAALDTDASVETLPSAPDHRFTVHDDRINT